MASGKFASWHSRPVPDTPLPICRLLCERYLAWWDKPEDLDPSPAWLCVYAALVDLAQINGGLLYLLSDYQYHKRVTVEISDSVIINNTATTLTGGVISLVSRGADNTFVTITGGLFMGNQVKEGFGGVVYMSAEGGKLTMTDVIAETNMAGDSGVVKIDRGILELLNSTFERNVAENGGGVISATNGAQVIISSCTMSGNTASTGGAINSMAGVRLQMINTTLSHNTALQGTIPYERKLPLWVV
ncbi:hypothetical protein CYMTET_23315 [Cymbomonas tetramitiformis]|uniref:Right handed beta helix domain-containing protein n=1 Tax=Cymbomonas tetramitiformis TaxID=36881 RepID=A0AAE0FYN4_9CHLO|nr:hypothetical protein CYMTET_23315 [Cymbomonas tetramitiformis]